MSDTNITITENQFFMAFIEATDLMCVLVVIEEDIMTHDGECSVTIDMEVVTFATTVEEKEFISTIESFFSNILVIDDMTRSSSSSEESSEESSEVEISDVEVSDLSLLREGSKPINMISTCDQFSNVEKVAQIFVDTLLQDVNVDDAVSSSSTKFSLYSTSSSAMGESSSSSSSSWSSSSSSSSSSPSSESFAVCRCYEEIVEEESEYDEWRKPVEWPSIENFTEDLGLQTIKDYIHKSWYPPAEWHYNVYLILRQSDQCADYYTYQSVWSLPNKQYPVPQVYTSIYFIIKVSRIIPVNCLVDVCYYYEGTTYRFSPCNTSLNEHFMYKMLQSKLDLYQSLTY